MVFLASYCKLSQTLKFSNEFSPNGFLNCKFTISFQPAVPTELMTAVCKAGWVHRTALACQPKALAHPHRSHPHSRSLVTTNSGPRPARPNHSCPGSFLGSYNHSRRLTFHNFILSYRLVFQRTMKKSTLLKKKKKNIFYLAITPWSTRPCCVSTTQDGLERSCFPCIVILFHPPKNYFLILICYYQPC